MNLSKIPGSQNNSIFRCDILLENDTWQITNSFKRISVVSKDGLYLRKRLIADEKLLSIRG